MTSSDEHEIVSSLGKIIHKWMEGEAQKYDMGFYSPNTAHHMAVATAQVLSAQSESQEYAVREGFLNKGD